MGSGVQRSGFSKISISLAVEVAYGDFRPFLHGLRRGRFFPLTGFGRVKGALAAPLLGQFHFPVLPFALFLLLKSGAREKGGDIGNSKPSVVCPSAYSFVAPTKKKVQVSAENSGIQ